MYRYLRVILGKKRQRPVQKSQHVRTTSSNIVGCNMFASFEHFFGSCWLEFKLALKFSSNIVRFVETMRDSI
jgi:hypothetical protein